MANRVFGKSPCSDWFLVRILQYGPIHVFLFWSEVGKFKICNQNSGKKV